MVDTAPDLAALLRQQGYAILPKALPPNLVADMRSRVLGIAAAARQVPRGRALLPTEGVQRNGLQSNGAFILRSLVNVPPASPVHPFLGYMEAVARLRVWPEFPSMHMVFAGHADLQANTSKGWHRDAPTPKTSWRRQDGSQNELARYDAYSPFALWQNTSHSLYRVVLYLEDHSADNGALLVLPGSHVDKSIRPLPAKVKKSLGAHDQRGRHLSTALAELEDPRVVVLKPALGDALLIDHRILHRGGDIHGSPGPRLLVQFSFGEEGAPHTEAFRAIRVAGMRAERHECPAAYALCLCQNESVWHSSCGKGGCGSCGPRFLRQSEEKQIGQINETQTTPQASAEPKMPRRHPPSLRKPLLPRKPGKRSTCTGSHESSIYSCKPDTVFNSKLVVPKRTFLVGNLSQLQVRYFSLIDVQSTPQLCPEGMDLLLLARTGQPGKFTGGFTTLLMAARHAQPASSSVVSLTTLISHPGVAHNLGATLAAGKLYGVGGQYRTDDDRVLGSRPPPYTERFDRKGIVMFEAAHLNHLKRERWQIAAQRQEPLVLMGDNSTCIDNHFVDGHCEFDGKLSLAFFRGKFHVYARLNLMPRDGRNTQVAISEGSSARGPYGRFSQVQVREFPTDTHQIYFPAVKTNPIFNETLLGIFPVSASLRTGVSFIGVAVSCDGIHFGKMSRICSSESRGKGRSVDHPVDGLVLRGGALTMMVQRRVPGIAPGKSSTDLVEYQFHLVALRQLIRKSLATVEGCQTVRFEHRPSAEARAN